MAVPANRMEWVASPETCGELGQDCVLLLGVGTIIRPLKLDSDRKIIALRPALKLGHTGMPGAIVTGNKLGDAAWPSNEKVSRHFQSLQATKPGMRIELDLVQK